jgi:anthranilate/para-aminobenzoate synthase component II
MNGSDGVVVFLIIRTNGNSVRTNRALMHGKFRIDKNEKKIFSDICWKFITKGA